MILQILWILCLPFLLG